MKILLINKYHYLKGGAERAYFDTARVLQDAGHEVAFFSMFDVHNEPTPWSKYFVTQVEYGDDQVLSFWQKFRLAVKIIWNREAQRKLELLLQEFQPDVAHLHNIYHQLSPSIIWTLKKHKILMVMTLHDYKLISPNYSLFVRGKIWEHSKPNQYWRCAQDRCVKNSIAKSLICTIEAYVHEWFDTYSQVNQYIAPSHFLIGKFREYGFTQLITYVPQPITNSSEDADEQKEKNVNAPFVFLGRLSEEKGVDVAIRAMQRYMGTSKLQIIGDGPERMSLEHLVTELNLETEVEFLGVKRGKELKQILQSAKALIVPSVWYENMPYVVLEALTQGLWVIASRSGGIPERIEDGVNGNLFSMGNLEELADCFEKSQKIQIKKEDRETLKKELSVEKYCKTLEMIYGELFKKLRETSEKE